MLPQGSEVCEIAEAPPPNRRVSSSSASRRSSRPSRLRLLFGRTYPDIRRRNAPPIFLAAPSSQSPTSTTFSVSALQVICFRGTTCRRPRLRSATTRQDGTHGCSDDASLCMIRSTVGVLKAYGMCLSTFGWSWERSQTWRAQRRKTLTTMSDSLGTDGRASPSVRCVLRRARLPERRRAASVRRLACISNRRTSRRHLNRRGSGGKL